MAMVEQRSTTTNHGQKACSPLTTVGSSTTNWILIKIGCAPITNVISNIYCNVSVKQYQELMHQATLTYIVHRGSLHLWLPAILLWGGKSCCALIATPNVDNAKRRQKKRQKLNYKLHVILMQKGIVVLVFSNYLDDVQVWNYAMRGFKRGIKKVGRGSVPTCFRVLNSLKFWLLPKNCQTGKL